MLDVDQKNAWGQKDAGKWMLKVRKMQESAQRKKSDIFTISRPRKSGEHHKAKDGTEVLSGNIINIKFVIDDPRTPN